MSVGIQVLIGLIAIEHLWFLILEMFLWTHPIGLKVFRLDLKQAQQSAQLAANQGLYNGFLVAGLIWSLLSYHGECGFSVRVFFLSCVLIAGLYGGYSVGKKSYLCKHFPQL